MAELLQRAYNEKYIVGAFSSWNIEMVKANLESAIEEESPIILESGYFTKGFTNPVMDPLMPSIKLLTKNVKIPVAIHLDHASNLQTIMQGIRLGVTSVMIDGSHLTFEENVMLTRNVVEIAHSVGVSVEAEFGRLTKAEDGKHFEFEESNLTDPRGASEFVNKTKVDALAVSVGNVHGLYESKAQIDFDRVKAINDLVGIPLVLHGGSGIPEEAVKKLRRIGVSKINIGHAVQIAFTNGLRKALSVNLETAINPILVFESARKEMKREVKKRIKMFGSSRKSF